MSKVVYDYGIEKVTPRGIFGFYTQSPMRSIHRSGGVSRARLKYRVLLANRRNDGSRYRFVEIRILKVPRP